MAWSRSCSSGVMGDSSILGLFWERQVMVIRPSCRTQFLGSDPFLEVVTLKIETVDTDKKISKEL